MYGNTFVSSYGEKPDPVWRWAINKTDEEAIKRGVVACMDAGGDFPPSLPKFLEYCNPKPAGVRFLGTPVSPNSLEAPKADREAIDRHLANMRRMLAQQEKAPDWKGRAITNEPPKPPAKGCTCKSEGTCDVCRAYAKLANGESAEIPRD